MASCGNSEVLSRSFAKVVPLANIGFVRYLQRAGLVSKAGPIKTDQDFTSQCFAKGTTFANERLRTSEFTQLANDLPCCQRCYLDRYCGPTCQKSRLEFSMICPYISNLLRLLKLYPNHQPATHMNSFARIATSFSWNKHAPPPFIQFRSSSTSSAPSKAMSI